MCGIVGLIKFDGKNISEFQLNNFTLSLEHRGPDSNGIFLDESKTVGLGHTRTSIFDLSKDGSQPMSCLSKRYWITFNGTIYNFIEIKKELELLGHKFKSSTDTEVILVAYLEWGDQCQFKFNGDWAFAIWDEIGKNLFVSCDRFGTKPLYYIQNKSYFIFASELKAFMCLKDELKQDFDYSFFLWLGKNHGSINTFLKNVFLLPGGFQINVNQNRQFVLKKWWKTIDHLVDVPKNYNDQVLLFKDLFFNSCKIRLRSDVPIASGLSGGLDSSSIVSTIEKIKEANFNISRYGEKFHKVFFCEFKNDENSEKKFAKDLIINRNLLPTYLEIDPSNVTPEELIKVQFYNESIDMDTLQLFLLYKKMREQGVRTSIDGTGADELMGGYWDDPSIAMKDVVWPWNEKGRFDDLALIKNNITNKTNSNSKLKIMLRTLIGEKNYRNLVNLYQKRNFFHSKKKTNYQLIDKSKNIYVDEDNISNLDYFNSHLYRQFHYYNVPSYCLKWDKISMSHGVLTRAPFLDHNLVTYMFSLPSKSKIGNGFTKRILRDSMKNIVPTNILNRTDKRGFTSPDNWYEKNMKNYILDNLNSSEFLNSNIFDGKKIRSDYENKAIFDKNPSKIVLRYIQIIQLINSFKKSSIQIN